MNLKDLTSPMPHQWRVQTVKEYGADCVAYVDSRDVQRRLDDVCGPENWQDDYFEIGGKVYCKIGILCGDKWVWKSDCGTESNVEKEKGQASDAFKRAAVKWGIGRFLYDLKIIRLKAAKYKEKFHPADDAGNILWDKDQLSAYCEAKSKGTAPKSTPKAPQSKPELSDAQEEFVSKLKIALEENLDGSRIDMAKLRTQLINGAKKQNKEVPSDASKINEMTAAILKNTRLVNSLKGAA